MFASDLGELFSGVGGTGTGTHSVAVVARNNAELSHNPVNVAQTAVDTSAARHGASISANLPKTNQPSGTTAALEHLFSSEYDIATKPTNITTSGNNGGGQTGSNVKTNAKLQPQSGSTSNTLTSDPASTTATAKKPGVPPFSHIRGSLRCPVCDKAFSNSSAIAKHKLTHSEERKYVCGICHKAFKRQDHLNGHKYTHESKKPHACHFCDKSYSDARSLRRHYENAHPEEYGRWLVLSQATNGDTSAIAVAAAAALFSGLDNASTDQGGSNGGSGGGKEIDASTSALLSSVFNSPVCGVLGRTATAGFGVTTSSDTLKSARSGSASPASSSAVNENQGCSLSTATSPTAMVDPLDREDEETHETRSLVSITAEEMATAAKVALMMAHPLEAPKRVACAVCQKRFKNQSALNGHMRLHGGYGPAGITAHNSGGYGPAVKSTGSEDHERVVTTDKVETALGNKRQLRSQNSMETNLQSPNPMSNNARSPIAHSDESSQSMTNFVSARSSGEGPLWRPESQTHGFQREHGSSRYSVNEASSTAWLQDRDFVRLVHNPATAGDLRQTEQRSFEARFKASGSHTEKCSKPSQYPVALTHGFPRSASASTVSSMAACCTRSSKPMQSENSWPMGVMDIGDDWNKPGVSGSFGLQLSANSLSRDNTIEATSGMTWLSKSQQLVWNSEPRRSDNSAWTNMYTKADVQVDDATATRHSKQSQFLDLDIKALSDRPWNPSANRSLPCEEKIQPRRPCNPPPSLDLSDVSIINRPIRIDNMMSVPHSSGMTTCPSTHPGQQPHGTSAFRSQLALQHGQPPVPPSQVVGSFVMANQYSPVTPAPGSASIPVDQHLEQPMAFTFPPATESVQSVNNITDSSSYPTDPHMSSRVTGNIYCTSPPARLTSVPESSFLGDKGSNERVGLRHSSSSGKLAPLLLNRWPVGQVNDNRPFSTQAPGSYLNQGVHQQMSHQYEQGDQHNQQQQQLITHCNMFNNPTDQSYRLNESWSNHSAAASSRDTQQVLSGPVQLPPPHPQAITTATTAQHSDGLFSLVAPMDSTDRLYCSRQRFPSDHQAQGSKPSEPRPAFLHPYPDSLENHHPSQRTAFNDRFRNTAHARASYPTCTEVSNSFVAETLFHPFGDPSTTLPHDQLRRPTGEPEPERTRHTSAPILRPDDRSSFHIGTTTNTGSRGYPGDAFFTGTHYQRARSRSPSYTGLHERMECSDIETGQPVILSPHHQYPHAYHQTNQGREFTTSDTVADLLMQSHITDPFAIPEKLSMCNTVTGEAAALTSSSEPDVPDINRCGSVTPVVSYVTASAQDPAFLNPPVMMSEAHIGLPLTTHSLSAKPNSDATQANAGSSSADESEQSVVTRLSKSMAEDNLFRNPHTIPPPKKLKRKPAPIFIPPQTGANLSRLRSPRVWGSDGSALHTSPLPYTPPPMLSPNRRGSGLFSSLSRWPSTASPVVTSRRYSSYYPFSATGLNGDSGRRKLSNLPHLSFGSMGTDSDTGQLSKRTYTNGMGTGAVIDMPTTNVSATGDTSKSTLGPTPVKGFSTDGSRQFAFPKRRCQLTPKSAPVLLQEVTASLFQNFNQDTELDDRIPEGLPTVSNGTIFGYDDETMRRIAEADAADRARRVCRSRRRCDTEHLQSGPVRSNHAASQVKPENGGDGSMHVDQELEREQVDDLMNCKPQVELEIVEDTLAVLDEEMQDQADVYPVEEDEDVIDEEGLPSSLIPRINIGDAFQAEIPDLVSESISYSTSDTENRELLLWHPQFIDEDDPKNIDSLNLLMKLSCSPAVRNCGLNMEYTFHLLCKYEGNVEKALHALLHDTLVVYDYVYAETAVWTTEEIARFQLGLTVYGRDFYLVARDLQASGMNKTVKACVEFYYVWKRMNTPTDVKGYRDKARRQRVTNTREDNGLLDDAPLASLGVLDSVKDSVQSDLDAVRLSGANSSSTYNLRRKVPHTTTHWRDRSTVLSTVPEQMNDSQRLHTEDNTVLHTACSFNFTESATVDDGMVDELVSSYCANPITEDSYPCRFCDRVFNKVKSRNAHMKSHSDRAAASTNRPLPQTTC